MRGLRRAPLAMVEILYLCTTITILVTITKKSVALVNILSNNSIYVTGLGLGCWVCWADVHGFKPSKAANADAR